MLLVHIFQFIAIGPCLLVHSYLTYTHCKCPWMYNVICIQVKNGMCSENVQIILQILCFYLKGQFIFVHVILFICYCHSTKLLIPLFLGNKTNLFQRLLFECCFYSCRLYSVLIQPTQCTHIPHVYIMHALKLAHKILCLVLLLKNVNYMQMLVFRHREVHKKSPQRIFIHHHSLYNSYGSYKSQTPHLSLYEILQPGGKVHAQ